MRGSIPTAAWGRVLGVAVFLGAGLAGRGTSAQSNTYADFPYNQGSLMYRPGGAAAVRDQAVRRAAAAPAPTGYRYQNPQPFAQPVVPGYPSYPAGARYRWPGGLVYRNAQGRGYVRPPVQARYYDYQRTAPRKFYRP